MTDIKAGDYVQLRKDMQQWPAPRLVTRVNPGRLGGCATAYVRELGYSCSFGYPVVNLRRVLRFHDLERVLRRGLK